MSADQTQGIVEQVIATWREAAAFEMTEMGNTQFASALDQCANELEAALRDLPVREEPQKVIEACAAYLERNYRGEGWEQECAIALRQQAWGPILPSSSSGGDATGRSADRGTDV